MVDDAVTGDGLSHTNSSGDVRTALKRDSLKTPLA